MRVLLLHGWGGSDFPHWQSWLAGELAKEYGCVSFPELPNKDAPKLEEWMDAVTDELESVPFDVVVCHSLGNIVWFHLAKRRLLPYTVKKLLLVAPPSLQCEIAELSSFFPLDLPQELFAEDIELIASGDDPYITLDEVQSIAEQLKITPTILEKAGHINAQSGFGAWEDIKKRVQE